MTITFQRPKGVQPAAAAVQTSTDLATAPWATVPNRQAAATVTDLGDHERVAYTVTLNPADPRRFWRVVFE